MAVTEAVHAPTADESARSPIELVRRFIGRPYLVVAAVLFGVMLFRNRRLEYRTEGRWELVDALPQPISDYRGGAVISPIFARILGVGTDPAWYALHLLLTFVLLGGVFVLAWRRGRTHEQRVFIAVAIAASAMPVTLLIRVGHYDLWFLAGAALVGLGRGIPSAAIGAALMAFTNVEQSVVAIVTFGLVALTLGRDVRRVVAVSGAVIVAAWLALRMWYLAYGVDVESRGGLLWENARAGWDGFTRSIPFQIYSWFSAAWLVVLGVADRWKVLAALIVLPALFTILTVDGTRVFVACVLPAFLLLVASAADRLDAETLRRLSAWTLVAAVLLPGISTFVGGVALIPRM